jgi:hypothetical protein
MRNIDASLWKNPNHPHTLFFEHLHLDDLAYFLILKIGSISLATTIQEQCPRDYSLSKSQP